MSNILCHVLLAAMAASAAEPKLVRIAIVDNSGSMRGERIATVRKELRSVVQQLPPSPEFPLLLIVFDETVGPTQILTDPKAAEKTISDLQGNGPGTRIAPALQRAADEINNYQRISTVLVMLYTDGEDNDQPGIRRAEAQLNSMFADRSRQGLSQTVFVKRWGNANAELIASLRASGNVQVLDAGELSVEPLTMNPVVHVIESRRDPQNPDRLQVVYAPALTLNGRLPATARPNIIFECQTDDARGQTRTEMVPNSKPERFTLTVPIPVATDQAPELSLVFQVSQALSSPTAGKFVLPIFSTSKIVVPVAVPKFTVHNRLTADIRQAKVVGWADPEQLVARCQMELAITVTATEKTTRVDQSTTFQIVPAAGIRLANSSDRVQIPGPGTYPITLAINVPTESGGSSPSRHTQPMEFSVQPVGKPNYLSYDPPQAQVRQTGLDAPKPAATTVTPLVQRIGKPVWVDLTEPLAAFDADVLFRVDGPIPLRTTLTLVAPGNVRGKLLPAGTRLHSGESIVTLHVVARLTPGNRERLDFSVVPPPATPAIEFQVERGFSLPVMAPPAAAIVAADQAAGQKILPVSAADNQQSIDLTLTPAVTGVDCARLRRLPRVVASTDDHDSILGARVATLLRPWPLRLRLAPLASPSFFVDSNQTVNLELRSEIASPAIVPARLQVIVTRQAPFKRLLVYLAWAAFPMGMLLLMVHVIRRLREGVST